MDRREFLTLGGTAALGLLVGCGDRSTNPRLLTDVLADAELARSFGQAFLDEGGKASADWEIAELRTDPYQSGHRGARSSRIPLRFGGVHAS